ncbi:xanthan lyase [Prolixibacter bellariivorans]|uniref:Xanthan lyase n=1 Tax=Prolixibacter bellariivorans TaxID=314319 RepID=A0A5M4B2I6_9BACT|nr:hypothetical protein [Prolixibacter bellariivorans]GET34106.1 xanthan lyase [Prolixibacter bellariivorans]
MASLHHIRTVATYESKTLFRSWFFRIFAILALVFVFFFNLFYQTKVGFPFDDMVALPAKVPFMNLYIINMAQAIIAIFLASDFLKRDKKLDTTEVIYMRSMSNADYVIGKTLGNLYVFLLLNVVALVMVAVFNLISPYSAFRLMPYFYYFFLVSVPTLLFILGLAFLLMSVIRNQALTFILLLGYIAATLFYLQGKFHFLFDYMAYQLPLTWSDFVGFGNLNSLLMQRGIYFFLGVGFICLTILLLKRLNQSKTVNGVVTVIGAGSLIFALVLGFFYVNRVSQFDNHRKEMIALNDQYAQAPVMQMTRCDLDVKHKGNTIAAVADMELKNSTNEPVKEIILTLNPGLSVTNVEGAGYQRDQQLLKIQPQTALAPGDSLQVKVSYAGTIDESLCYLEYDRERLDLITRDDNATIDKRHAFVRNNYVLLTPEVRWYPTPGVNYASKGLGWLHKGFTHFSLTVEPANDSLKVLSQGEKTIGQNGTITFRDKKPLPQISLVMGNYQTRSITVDSIQYSLTYLKGHDRFDEFFKEINDSLAPVIRDLKNTYEAKLQLRYPFRRLELIEVPVQFYSYSHLWTAAREQVQPEMVFLPEGGYMVSGANFALSKRWAERRSKRTNESITERESEENLFRDFVNRALLSKDEGRGFRMRIGGMGRNADDNPNPYFIFPDYYSYVNEINSPKYPIMNRVVESYLVERTSDDRPGFMRNFLGMSSDEKGNMELQDKSFAQVLQDQDDPDIVDNIIQTKGEFLFALMKAAAGEDKFDNVLNSFLEKNRFRETGINDLKNDLASSFNLQLDDYLSSWYNSKELPGYLVNDVEAVKVKDGDRTSTMVTFHLSNTGKEPGVVKFTFRLGGQGRRGRRFGGGGEEETVERIVAIAPHQTKRVGVLLNEEPRMMMTNTFASANIPAVLTQRFEKIELDEKRTPFDGEEVIDYDNGTAPNETIVDNEDPEFKLVQPESSSFLKKIFQAQLMDNEDQKYKGLNFWRPPVEWTLTTNTNFYGKTVRSAYYTKGGTGDREAIWNVPIKDAGYYTVFAYVPKINMRWRGEDKGEYTYTIHHDDGEDHPAVDIKNTDGGWVELGAYYFSPDTAKIELTNKTEASIVYADAVKLVKEK